MRDDLRQRGRAWSGVAVAVLAWAGTLLYCACPFDEAGTAYQILRDLGYRNISVMEEGFAGWTKRGYPIER